MRCEIVNENGEIKWNFLAENIEKTKFDGFPCIKIVNPEFDLTYFLHEIFPKYGTLEILRFTYEKEQEYKTFKFIENIRRQILKKPIITLQPGHIPIYRYESTGIIYLFI